jgi:hypothetical protein
MSKSAWALCLAASFWGAALAWAGPPERALEEAQVELARIEQLVQAGVAPRKMLEEAAANFAEARDEATLASTLYAQIELSQFTPEMAKSMLDAAQNRFARREAALKDAQTRTEMGVLARTALMPLIEELDRARRTRDDAQVRAQLFEELAAMARSEVDIAAVTVEEAMHSELLPAAIRYDGKGVFNDAHWRKVVLAFEKEFRHGLRISAKGDTLYHRTLGFDHRGRIDIALDPDSKEGQWLRGFLETQQIPYFAYRRAVIGQASAPHIHLGPPSPKWQS